MTEYVHLIMRNKYQVIRFDVDEHMKDSRTFMKKATKELAKALLGGGCVKVTKQYDIDAGGHWTTCTVLSGREETKLP